MPYPEAVVFDLDGTLVDTAGDLHLVLHELMEAEGLPTPTLESVRGMIGDGARALVERGFNAAGVTPGPGRLDELYTRFLDLYVEEPCRDSRLYPGALEALDALEAKGCRLGICTNKPQRPTELLLELLGVAGRFGAILGGDAVASKKPDAAHLVAVLDRLGATAADAVMVGDSRNDLLTARAAGVPCVLVTFGYTQVPARELGADVVVDSLADVPGVLERL